MAYEHSLKRLQALFRELFQFDFADLDFGLYRLFHVRRTEIEAFINEQLPREVDAVFEAVTSEEQERVNAELRTLVQQIREQIAEDAILPTDEVNPQYSGIKLVKQYAELRKRLADSEASEAHKAEVFNHLYNFFSRYYEDGDFVPKRRYGARETYAVPYSGEEVFFTWANRDQHYIKTAETFKDYAFKVSSLTGEYRVRFTMAEASIPKDNTKGNTRYFFPRVDLVTYNTETHEFTLPFDYRLPTWEEAEKYGNNSKAQEAILEEMLPHVLEAVPDTNLRVLLSQPVNENDGTPTVLLKRLRHFCRRNTSDYFIHKDLRGFLTRELEFYIKDQIIHLMDLEADLDAKRRVVKAFRKLGEKMIGFLATIEDAQKTLFEKKKFVLETDYLIPIQYVPRDIWSEVLQNEKQLEEWRHWLTLEPTKDLFNPTGELNETFLEAHPTLPMHTRHFDRNFVRRLLESLPFADLDEATDGLLVYGENYQALRLLAERYRGQVKCIYIDPPFNAKSSEILYKNNYKHSSWLSLMDNRIKVGKNLLQKQGVQVVAIDEVEQELLGQLLVRHFPGYQKTCVTVVSNPSGQQGENFSYCHEYAYFIYPSGGRFIGLLERTESPDIRPLRDVSKGNHLRESAANCFYPILIRGQEIVGFGDVCDESFHPGSANIIREGGIIEVYPIDAQGNERKWVWARDTVETIKDQLSVVYNHNRDIWDIIRKKTRFNYKTVWWDKRYSANSYGSKLLNNILGRESFSFPKSIHTVMDCVHAASGGDRNALVLDYFAGSGTTGHAVINLNRKDGGDRKFILVEMERYFDTVLLSRIAKVIYAPEWKDGKPMRQATPEEAQRTPRLIKVLRLESYEDALHNLAAPSTLERAAERGAAVKSLVAEDAYRLRYWIEIPLQEAETCLRSLDLHHPFHYSLEVLTENGPVRKPVDVAETFNYLYGLRVKRYETWEHQGRTYRIVKAADRDKKRRILVIWRDMKHLDVESERAFLEGRIAEMTTGGETWDEILINGDSAVPDVRSLDPLFKRLMMTGEVVS